ncbi:pilin assembly protein [Pseudomonas entomophila]|uniref:pilin assembly protein n=1 Tax=Pseudomonas entomophila TaxID=312306 RepID=UPI003EC0F667
MKIRELAQHWEQDANGLLSPTEHVLHLDIEAEARLAALAEMYPRRTVDALLGELVGAALEELEASFPYVKGEHVISTDEEGDPLYEDVGATPRFLALARHHLHRLESPRSGDTTADETVLKR